MPHGHMQAYTPEQEAILRRLLEQLPEYQPWDHEAVSVSSSPSPQTSSSSTGAGPGSANGSKITS